MCRPQTYTYTLTHMHTYIYVYKIFPCTVHVCVCVRERERERERERVFIHIKSDGNGSCQKKNHTNLLLNENPLRRETCDAQDDKINCGCNRHESFMRDETQKKR